MVGVRLPERWTEHLATIWPHAQNKIKHTKTPRETLACNRPCHCRHYRCCCCRMPVSDANQTTWAHPHVAKSRKRKKTTFLETKICPMSPMLKYLPKCRFAQNKCVSASCPNSPNFQSASNNWKRMLVHHTNRKPKSVS